MGFFKKLFGKPMNEFFAPVVGKAVPVSQVPDPTFAEELLGKGIAIEPAEGKVYAPCNATVDMMFETGHAVSLVADCGAEVLIHVGLETVTLKGKHFTIHAANGDKVKKGDLLIEFDLEAIKAEGFNVITPMLICNSGDYGTFKTNVGKAVTNADVVIELAKQGERYEARFWSSRIPRRGHRPCCGLPESTACPACFLRRSRR